LRRRLAYVDGDGADAPTNTSCSNRCHMLYSGKKKAKERKEKERQEKKSADKKATVREEDWRIKTKIKE